MPAIRGITVAVGSWYARTLEICLPRNMRHLTECVVVTTPEDEEVRAVVEKVPGAILSTTDAFTRHGARFNKGLSIEQAGLDIMGRHGWILIHDADVIFPDDLALDRLRPETIHGARRRILEDPARWSPGLDWATLPMGPDTAPIGFFQLVPAECQALRDRRPWYDVSFAHAGGGDAYFLGHFPPNRRAILPVECLHLGPVDTHWFGTDEASKDLMAKFVTENGWMRAAAKFGPEAVARAGEVVTRVEVPGYEPSRYELMFVRRARAAKGRG